MLFNIMCVTIHKCLLCIREIILYQQNIQHKIIIKFKYSSDKDFGQGNNVHTSLNKTLPQ